MAENTSPTTNTNQPTTASATPSLKDPNNLTFAEKAQLTFKKYQFVNGKGYDKIAAEDAARAELGIAPLTEEEKKKSAEPNLFEKIVDNPVFVSLGWSALIHQKIEGAKADAKAKIAEKVEQAEANVGLKAPPAAETTASNPSPAAAVQPAAAQNATPPAAPTPATAAVVPTQPAVTTPPISATPPPAATNVVSQPTPPPAEPEPPAVG